MQFPWKAYENRGWKKFKSYCVGFLSIKFLMSYALIATASWTNYTLPTTSWYTIILIRISIISRSPACCRNGEIWLWIIPSSAGAMSLHQNYFARTYACTRGFLIQCSLFACAWATNPREREEFWPWSGFGNFDLLLLLLVAAATRIPNEISP